MNIGALLSSIIIAGSPGIKCLNDDVQYGSKSFDSHLVLKSGGQNGNADSIIQESSIFNVTLQGQNGDIFFSSSGTSNLLFTDLFTKEDYLSQFSVYLPNYYLHTLDDYGYVDIVFSNVILNFENFDGTLGDYYIKLNEYRVTNSPPSADMNDVVVSRSYYNPSVDNVRYQISYDYGKTWGDEINSRSQYFNLLNGNAYSDFVFFNESSSSIDVSLVLYDWYKDGGSVTTEVIDVNGFVLDMFTMPFTFLSTFLNFTFFAGTPYAFNLSSVLISVTLLMFVLGIILLVARLIK